MTIIVTGAAGFIGSNIIKALNTRGITDIIAVDNLSRSEKFKNLTECEISHYLDKHEFIRQLREHALPYEEIKAGAGVTMMVMALLSLSGGYMNILFVK